MFERIKSIAGFIIRHPKDAVIIVLSLICIFLNWLVGVERRKAQRSQEIRTDLPADTKQIVTVYRDRVVTKWHDGPVKIQYSDRYLPPEGQLTLRVKEDAPSGSAPEIKIKEIGFTCRLGGGIVYSDELLPQADIKWLYFRRYSLITALTPRFGGLGLCRHVDDFTPFKNLELLADAGIGWHGELRLGLGIRSNF